MTQGFKDLTGRWLGRYDQGKSAVPFEADLIEDSGVLTGETQEPNSFQVNAGADLTATLSGGRTARSVSFVKHYNTFDQGDDPVYDGQVNAKLTRITGRWVFPRSPWITGPFVMMRKPLASAKAKITSSEAIKATVD